MRKRVCSSDVTSGQVESCSSKLALTLPRRSGKEGSEKKVDFPEYAKVMRDKLDQGDFFMGKHEFDCTHLAEIKKEENLQVSIALLYLKFYDTGRKLVLLKQNSQYRKSE